MTEKEKIALLKLSKVLYGLNQSMDSEKTQADTKHYNEYTMTVVVLRVKIDFYWLPKASGYASNFMLFFFSGLVLIEQI